MVQLLAQMEGGLRGIQVFWHFQAAVPESKSFCLNSTCLSIDDIIPFRMRNYNLSWVRTSGNSAQGFGSLASFDNHLLCHKVQVKQRTSP
jgi:hypothetical protein